MNLDGWVLGHELDDSFPLPTAEPFTAAHAPSEGLTPHDLTRLVTDGLLRRVAPLADGLCR